MYFHIAVHLNIIMFDTIITMTNNRLLPDSTINLNSTGKNMALCQQDFHCKLVSGSVKGNISEQT